ncbi:ABC transporter ATP-binding protein [Amycolatopsis sp. EV170708-02-1]|uniref:ABC transporter ATP-binding protein n=1 Tax=Amycolatopsis sp. EV170708-02-1 TaxID=2919322 RepID=UPI001F0BE674|nr:ABC transporter ATP-binding protein [Amycolatopsis sp. EV170708-02-1]UMP06921.1 ABC transporter ATP-binding protein [Amycolatopsis sp. EV170708-02-1]
MPPDPPISSAVGIRGLTRRFGPVTAVDDVDLDVSRGEYFSLLGPSGCGKTSILRMIAGLLTETSGTVWLGGTDMTGLPAHRRPVTTVFQDYALFPHLDVAGNVAFGLRQRGIRGRPARAQVDAMLEQVGLSGRAGARPQELSGGQRQRVALARSLVLRPEVLLLDEPLGALDLSLRKQMQVLLRRLQRETATTFVQVTHDQAEAFMLSDRVAILSEGRLQQVATPSEVYRRPANGFVASFVGEVNRFAGTVCGVRDGGRCYDVLLPTGRMVMVPGAPGLLRGSPVAILVRPEDLTLDQPRTDSVTMDATVTDLVFQGPVTEICARLGEGSEFTVSIAARAADDLAIGSITPVTWRPAESWLLPAQTA